MQNTEPIPLTDEHLEQGKFIPWGMMGHIRYFPLLDISIHPIGYLDNHYQVIIYDRHQNTQVTLPYKLSTVGAFEILVYALTGEKITIKP